MWRRLAGSLVVLCACSAPADRASGAPAVIVRVSTDLGVPSEIDRIEIRVLDGTKTTFEQFYDLPADARLPGTLTLAATDGKGAPPPGTLAPGTVFVGGVGATLTLSVHASLAGVPVVWRAARFAMPQSQRALELPLSSACALVMCPDGQTCDHGACIAEDVDSSALPGFGT